MAQLVEAVLDMIAGLLELCNQEVKMVIGRKRRRLLRFHFELLSQQIIKGVAVPANYPAIPVDQSLDGHANDAITPVDLSIFIQKSGKGEAVFP
jgi:hypothetical protein